LEKIQKFSDPILTICEICKGDLERVISSPAFKFKGSGWYATDYAKKSSVPASNSSGESSPSTEKKEAEKKEKDSSKPAEPVKASPSKD
jgi:predicted nucleic acid-binding Zn ribbon protein